MRKIFSVIFCLLSLSLSAQSKIKQAKNNLGTPQQTQSGSSSQSSGYSTSFGDSSVSFWDIFFESFLYDLTLALAYNIAFETEAESEGRMSRATLNRYPFYGNSKGDYQYEAPWEDFVLWRLEGSNYYFSEKDVSLPMILMQRFVLESVLASIYNIYTFGKNCYKLRTKN
ncbi:hypothetical protein ACILDS_05705 [Capnocytophaga canis]|uniref:hypothetical protein n=1 Tax=Capnocytophaga canis TaxID=1848903 RepID=UPI0037CCE7A5